MNFLNELIPRPTPPPVTRTLKRRAVTSSQTVTEGVTITIAPDATCGYIAEKLGASRVCPKSDDYCLMFPPVPSEGFSQGGIICCNEGPCTFHSSCINSEDYFTSSKCDDGCAVDNFILKCTNSAKPFCNTVSWEGSTFDYWCNDRDISTAQSAALTYEGQNLKDRGLKTLDEEKYNSIMAQMTQTESATESEATASETSNDSGSSKTPVGAIAGGTVGGVAALALLGVAIFFFLRRKKKQNQASNPPAYQQAPGGTDNKTAPWSPGQQQGAPYYYDPNTPSTAYTSPNPMYSQAGGYPAGYPPQQPAIHEAGGNTIENKPQELGDTGTGKKEPVELA
ncbi:hypothetical protein F53441_12481 [Fusarium austroafricanum]|uniref:Epidermal growth factor receptor-like transmembrane-juxtamembrane segment domain-containing protein n=1 Tax=Fusarium austroafricanum TaxID=2364996 RepID=A0A8H4JXF0_9HYPO|nr:hypothetical protein F53441_12481 [Fusarium austroafricanum]